MTADNKLTNLQRELLKVFHFDLSESQLLEIKQLLSTYFAEKATNEMDRLWESNNWNEEKMTEWSKEHLRKSSES